MNETITLTLDAQSKLPFAQRWKFDFWPPLIRWSLRNDQVARLANAGDGEGAERLMQDQVTEVLAGWRDVRTAHPGTLRAFGLQPGEPQAVPFEAGKLFDLLTPAQWQELQRKLVQGLTETEAGNFDSPAPSVQASSASDAATAAASTSPPSTSPPSSAANPAIAAAAAATT